jgi:hypothetical protein
MSLAPSGARPDTLAIAVKCLFALAVEAAGAVPSAERGAASRAGHQFEDEAAQAAYEALRRSGVTPRPPRTMLQLPTLSGLKQQFDVVIPDGDRYLIVELKRRSHSEIEQLYAFVGKLLDYALAARLHRTGHLFTGIFVSTATRLNNNFRQFALTYGVWPIAPDLLPCQIIQEQAVHPGLQQDATDLVRRLDVQLPRVALSSAARTSASLLLREWQSIAQRQG